jgi:hypothetical protein
MLVELEMVGGVRAGHAFVLVELEMVVSGVRAGRTFVVLVELEMVVGVLAGHAFVLVEVEMVVLVRAGRVTILFL